MSLLPSSSAFADVRELLSTPMPMTVLRRGRLAVGALVAAGAIAGMYGSADVAHAAPSSNTKTRAVASTASAPARTSVDSSFTVRLKSGDNLSTMAQRHGVSVSALVAVNGLKNKDRIVAGKTLLIPAKSGATAKTTKVTKQTVPKASAKLGPQQKATPGQPLPPKLRKSSRSQLAPQFRQAARTYNVPSDLLQAMAYQESGWQNRVTSRTGAKGIGQLMPDTVTFVNKDLISRPLDPSRTDHNIKMSAAYLRYLLDQTNGDTRLALAGYYQGLNAVRQRGVYNDTQQYVRSVLALQKSYF